MLKTHRVDKSEYQHGAGVDIDSTGARWWFTMSRDQVWGAAVPSIPSSTSTNTNKANSISSYCMAKLGLMLGVMFGSRMRTVPLSDHTTV